MIKEKTNQKLKDKKPIIIKTVIYTLLIECLLLILAI
jgi:membrane protein involved in colicin uptake